MPPKTGSKMFAEFMQNCGVTHVFFVPAIMLKALAEMEGMKIRRILTHGEKAAAYMADGYARASGRPGVCMAQAVGASNLAVGRRKAVSDFFGTRKIIVFSPNCSRADLLERYPEQVIIRNTWKDVLEELKDGPSGQSVAIFPDGSLQYTRIA